MNGVLSFGASDKIDDKAVCRDITILQRKNEKTGKETSELITNAVITN